VLCILAAVIKISWYLVDPRPALFMGDSGAYLTTGRADYIPEDRSFTYGYLLKYLALKPHSLQTVVLGQGLMSLCACCILAWLLLRFGAGWRTAAILVGLCATEPLQLMSERYVLTEATATLLFASLIAIVVAFSRSSRQWLVVPFAAVSVALVSIRVNFLPIVLLFSFLMPFVSPAGRRALTLIRSSKAHWRSAGASLLLTLCLSVGLLQAGFYWYRHLYRSLANAAYSPAFLYADGYFLLGDVAPIVTPEDYPVAQDSAWVFSHTTFPLKDPRAREAQRWMAGGICKSIEDVPGQSRVTGNRIAKKTALRAVKRDPIGFLHLSWTTFASYFDVDYLKETIHRDAADGQYTLSLSPADRDVLQRFYDFQKQPSDDLSAVRGWHAALWWWYPLLLVTPFAYVALLIWCWRVSAPVHWLLGLAGLCLWATAVVTVQRPTPRYLTTLAWLCFLLAGISVQLIRFARNPE
jgi:hypothetical protein